MRILLLHHHWLAESAAVELCSLSARALAAAGHDVRVLAICSELTDPHGAPNWLTPIAFAEQIAEPCGGLIGPPRFALEAGVGPLFVELSSKQLADYRGALRRVLDRQVESFNPHVVHAQHLWVWAQLALETGAPYVVSVWPDELAVDDARFAELAQQAAENCSRLLVCEAALAARIHALFGELESPIEPAPAAEALAGCYAEAVRQRLGPDADLS